MVYQHAATDANNLNITIILMYRLSHYISFLICYLQLLAFLSLQLMSFKTHGVLKKTTYLILATHSTYSVSYLKFSLMLASCKSVLPEQLAVCVSCVRTYKLLLIFHPNVFSACDWPVVTYKTNGTATPSASSNTTRNISVTFQ